jgi:hypothetical protein
VHTCSHPWGPNREPQVEQGIPLVHHVRTIDRQMSQRSSALNGNVSPSLRKPDGTRFGPFSTRMADSGELSLSNRANCVTASASQR